MIHRVYQPTQELGRWLRYLLWGSAASLIVTAITGFVDASRIGDLRDAGTTELPSAFVPHTAGLIATLASAVSLATVVVWLVWQHRSQSNLFAARLAGLRYTPGWAVGWWFVPFANLVMPFRTMRELWTKSGVDAAPRELVPWWVLEVLRLCTGVVVAVMVVSTLSWNRESHVILLELRTAQISRLIGAAGAILGIAQAFLAIRIVGAIDAAQLTLASASMPSPGYLGVPHRPDLGHGGPG